MREIEQEMIARVAADLVAAFENPDGDRIFALMGPNGAGKSRLIGNLFSHLYTDRGHRVLLLPTARTPAIGNAQLGHSFALPDGRVFAALLDEMTRPRRRAPSGQTPFPDQNPPGLWVGSSIILGSSWEKHRSDQARFDAAIREWGRGDRTSAPPDKPAASFDALKKYLSDVTRRECKIEIPQEGYPPRVTFSRDGESYQEGGLSDGEKQLVELSVLFQQPDIEPFIFLVDEPELHLNESLAAELWEAIERNLPKVVFLYATHNVLFATRPNVTRNYLIDSDGRIERIDPKDGIPSAVVRDFMGARVQILRDAAPLLFCEDKLLKTVLTDLLDGTGIKIVALTGCDSVRAAVKGEGFWADLRSEGMKHCGVIDRDARDDEELANLERKGIFCFPLYESDSILTDANVGLWLLNEFNSKEKITADDYADMLQAAASNALHQTLGLVRDHISENYRATVAFQLTASRDAFSYNVEQPKGPELGALFHKRADELIGAIAKKNVTAIPKLFSGKELFNRLACGRIKLKVTDSAQMYAIVHDKPGFVEVCKNLSWLREFRDKLLAHLL